MASFGSLGELSGTSLRRDCRRLDFGGFCPTFPTFYPSGVRGGETVESVSAKLPATAPCTKRADR